MSKSSEFARPRKAPYRPKKPYPEFPLTPHASGKWMKKIRNRIHYFGRWANWLDGVLVPIEGEAQWKPALEEYKQVADDLHAGREPRALADGVTVEDVCDYFLTHKERQRDAGEISVKMYGEYRAACDLMISQFTRLRLASDLRGDDFAALRQTMVKKWGPVRLGNTIGRVKSVFKYALENGHIDRPPLYGTEFKKPGKSVLRRHKAKSGPRLFTREEILNLIDGRLVPGGSRGPELVKPNPVMRAMILLGINCGLGNTDCARMRTIHVDLERGWLDFPRPKTGIERRCPLWPETIEALRVVDATRPKAETHEAVGRFFLNSNGVPFVRNTKKGAITDLVAVNFGKLLVMLEMPKTGKGFYTLRHCHRTVADAACDPVACDLIMGHADPSMGAVYRERIDDARLVAVVNVVRKWLWPARDSNGGQVADSAT